MATLDLAKVAKGVEIAPDNDLPNPLRRQPKDNPLADVVAEAAKDGKRRVLAGRYSLTPYPGRKGACDAFAIMSSLNRAAKRQGVKLEMRRYDVQGDSCRITFKVKDPAEVA